MTSIPAPQPSTPSNSYPAKPEARQSSLSFRTCLGFQECQPNTSPKPCKLITSTKQPKLDQHNQPSYLQGNKGPTLQWQPVVVSDTEHLMRITPKAPNVLLSFLSHHSCFPFIAFRRVRTVLFRNRIISDTDPAPQYSITIHRSVFLK